MVRFTNVTTLSDCLESNLATVELNEYLFQKGLTLNITQTHFMSYIYIFEEVNKRVYSLFLLNVLCLTYFIFSNMCFFLD